MACANCRRNKVQCDPERPCRVCVRRGLKCTLPSCTCAETGSEPGHCSFCRSQRVRKNSQTPVGSVMDYEERLSDISGTPSPITSNLPGFADRISFQVPLNKPNHSYGRHVTPQDNSLPIDNLASADPRPPYTASYSAQQQLGSRQQIGQGINSRQDMSVNFPQHSQPDFTQDGQVWRDFDLQGSAVDGGAGLDKYFARGLAMGPPAHSSCSSGQAGLLSQYHQEPSFLHLGNNANGRVNFDNGLGTGIGTSEADSLANIGDMSRSYGPVPMAMPVSMTIPVPHPGRSHVNTGVRNIGQMDMHPQLRRSAYYLTSDSRTARHGDGS
ncbi:uncharacterized protein FOMMEDRAFT_131297 [Fomitiporia mediterranea MF3/22]|uniref:uncharacterized protein n=1 Tax=Fomitiporia mediterranea (strain MF3/22) TaxID=694068 RepID=UPI00044084A9|nr:uncharacterized protein FOMMEDRAFT_131297 [Fomitiporia mediterranea MF3/22]EJD08579.1 hypothetical protein FOMMEDRAFT_131297 [Fomitiporia mediterranea MF3/22]